MIELKLLEDLDYENYKEFCMLGGYDKINECPLCHCKLLPELYGVLDANFDKFAICYCPECDEMFIIHYSYKGDGMQGYYEVNKIFPKRAENIKFDDKIQEVSEAFVKIYNQAKIAEANDLDEIAGMGYRKALEFLIKDYLIHKNSEIKGDIEGKLLGKCINENVENPKIKKMAKGASWLGNDETHYIRKWKDKDINDLKKMIDLTVYWIAYELKTEEYEEIMKL
ncbi:DUF4145 domain-containing protein [Clostridium perfringens]|uniref:DUF4145 domain-containing protein n=3 Tax=Clostridium perfringens TaxID=1502 RepID=A0AAW4J0N9_CLOPF|nr:DUF4145 domain-containing protein [Clostridium perfringens]DAL12351.1 MAG TPA_asm: TFIIB Transcription factor zinc-finger [Caudoviricetes sp.]EHP50428.1 hypothetical protein HMPREF9476_00380 [Clostridium perfringens WAL-14572]EIW6614091.1 DUF4145 domain-containing protein [Clostridium perfringens]MBO3354371.1 DUF4145 domain-containing protein [Clostridium perfringens]MBO3357641.1 DUF4145 domain-containing protein [Clostridium perfringens]